MCMCMAATGMCMCTCMLLVLHIEPVEDVSHHCYRSISMLQCCCRRCCRWPYLLLVLMLMLWRELQRLLPS
jgi:hypothetical protein